MKKLFLDANVLMDLLLDRQPFSMDAAMLFKLSKERDVELCSASMSFTIIYYVIRKQGLTHKDTVDMLVKLEKWVTILPVTGDAIRASLNVTFSDFEDAVQYECALSEKEIEAIVTRDKKGFQKSRLPVITPSEALRKWDKPIYSSPSECACQVIA